MEIEQAAREWAEKKFKVATYELGGNKDAKVNIVEAEIRRKLAIPYFVEGVIWALTQDGLKSPISDHEVICEFRKRKD